MTRERARELLVTLGPPVTQYILPLLKDHENQTRWEAAKALSEIADPVSIPALLHALEDDDNDVSWLAAESLVAIGPPAAAPLLRTLIEKIGSVQVRQGAHHVLRELRSTDIGDKITDIYTALDSLHPNVEIIAIAERALQSLKSEG
jgi:HEAT repeat protein